MELSNNNQKKGKRSAARWPFFLIGISLVVLVIAGWNLMQYYSSYREEKALNGKLQQIKNDIAKDAVKNAVKNGETGNIKIESDGQEESVDFSLEKQSAQLRETMVSINPDYVGWLELADTDISYPVVFRDNEYYINHDFEQRLNSHGAIFLDETCNEESFIWLIHGHHMKDGTMFAGLAEYKNLDYLKQHTAITLDVGDGPVTYRIYAAALIDFSNETELTPAFHYERLPEDMKQLQQWQNNLRNYSYWYDTNVQMQPEAWSQMIEENGAASPVILTLSTCEYGTELQRLILVAVKEKESE